MRFSLTQRRWFLGATVCTLLAILATLLLDLLLAHWRPTIDLSVYNTAVTLSERSRMTLTDTAGTLYVTCVFPAESPTALPAGRMMRVFKEASQALAGATMEITYVDPRIETNAAAQLMAQGAGGPGIFFRQAARTVFVPEQTLLSAEGIFDPVEAEAAIASALARLSREEGLVIGWLTGHGEAGFDSTDPLSGFSALRRALENEGCKVRDLALDVTSDSDLTIPKDINVLMIMAPQYPITATERALLSDWLDRGGRVFCALPYAGDAGLGELFERWGIRLGSAPRRPTRTTEGDAGLTTLLAEDHIVTRELAGQASLIFRAPRALTCIPLRGITLSPLVEMEVNTLPTAATSSAEEVPIMVASERGSRVGEDLAFRPGRLIVAGEHGFAENRYLLNHASANRDLAVNAVRWLTGLSGSGAPSGTGVIRIGQDRAAWHQDLLITALGVPFLLCFVVWFLTRRRV